MLLGERKKACSANPPQPCLHASVLSHPFVSISVGFSQAHPVLPSSFLPSCRHPALPQFLPSCPEKIHSYSYKCPVFCSRFSQSNGARLECGGTADSHHCRLANDKSANLTNCVMLSCWYATKSVRNVCNTLLNSWWLFLFKRLNSYFSTAENYQADQTRSKFAQSSIWSIISGGCEELSKLTRFFKIKKCVFSPLCLGNMVYYSFLKNTEIWLF